MRTRNRRGAFDPTPREPGESPTTHPTLLQVWQWGPPHATERNLEEICTTARTFGFTGVLIKALDGLNWHRSYFAGQDALGSVEQAAEQRAYVNGRGLGYYLWTNPLYLSTAERRTEQARLTGEIANVCDGLALDVEPYPQFWGAWRPVGAATRFMQDLRAVAPDALVIFQPDPRPARFAELRPEEWLPSCDVIAGQWYWTDFQTDPSAELAAAARLGAQWGKPVWPTLPGNTAASAIPLNQLRELQGAVLWRLGSAGAGVLQTVGGVWG